MRRNYLIYTVFYLLLFLIIPKYNYKPVKVKIEGAKDFRVFEKPDIIIYNDKNKINESPYHQKKLKDEFIVLNQSVWGICFKNIKPKFVLINGEAVELYRTKDLKNKCRFISEIKKRNEKFYSGGTVLSSILASMLILSLLIALFNTKFIIDLIKEKLDVPSLVFVFIQTIYYLVTYPGLFNLDFSHAAMLTLSGRYNDWFSYLNPLYLETMYRLGLSVGTLHIPLYGFGIFVTLLYYNLVKKLSLSKYYGWFVLFVFCLPPVALMNNFLTRDTLALYLNLISIYFILNKTYGKNSIRYEKILFIICIVMAGTIRREGVFFLSIMLFIYSFTHSLHIGNRIKFAIQVLLLFILTNYLGGFMAPDNNQYNRKQKITFTFAHYIGAIISNNYNSENYEEDKRIINKYYDYEILKKHHVKHDTLGLHFGARKWRGKPKLDELYVLVFKLIRDNFYIFLKSRVLMFKELIFPTRYLYTFADDYGEYIQKKQNVPLANTLQLSKVKDLLGLRDMKIINRVRSFLLNNEIKVLYSCLISMIILTVLALMYFKVKTLSMLALPFILKSGVMFILMQKAQFQYFADIYVVGFLFIPFGMYEAKKLFSFKKFI